MAEQAGSNRETNDNNMYQEHLRDPDPHQIQVERFLKPLAPNWDLIRDVLLWKKPVYSLLIFVAVNGIFCYFATGNFRLFLVGSVVIGLGLCVDEVRIQVAGVLERAGITPEERESYEASLVYQRFCYKIALIWGFVDKQLSKLKELKQQSDQKYYAVLVVMFIVVAFAYQYLPWLKLLYCTLLFLYLWPPAKYHGTHRVFINMIEPFFRPFIVHWRHSRTKRQREQILKVQKGVETEDSDEEFTNQFKPNVPKPKESMSIQEPAVDQDQTLISKTPLSDSSDEIQPPQLDHEDMSSSSSSQADIIMKLDLPASRENVSSDLETPGGSSVSFNSSSSFLPDSQELPSISMNTDHWEFEDDDFAQGLEFPDIDEKDYHSSNESLNASTEKKETNKKLETVNQEAKQAKQQSGQDQSNVADGSDFELLDKSEVADMDPAMNVERPESSSSLHAMGKWLGL